MSILIYYPFLCFYGCHLLSSLVISSHLQSSLVISCHLLSSLVISCHHFCIQFDVWLILFVFGKLHTYIHTDGHWRLIELHSQLKIDTLIGKYTSLERKYETSKKNNYRCNICDERVSSVNDLRNTRRNIIPMV